MKKVIVLGCPGSGKTTFAVKLHDLTKLPLYTLIPFGIIRTKRIFQEKILTKNLQRFSLFQNG